MLETVHKKLKLIVKFKGFSGSHFCKLVPGTVLPLNMVVNYGANNFGNPIGFKWNLIPIDKKFLNQCFLFEQCLKMFRFLSICIQNLQKVLKGPGKKFLSKCQSLFFIKLFYADFNFVEIKKCIWNFFQCFFLLLLYGHF